MAVSSMWRVRARRTAARVIAWPPAFHALHRVPQTALLAARAAFRTGRDDLLRRTLDRLAQRRPDSAAVPLLHADLLTFEGRYAEALAQAETAAARDPSWPAAAARVVRLGYRVRPVAEADEQAAAAVARFPTSGEVLWAAAMACASPEQYARLEQAWTDAGVPPAALPPVARQLAVAASRAGRLDAAAEWYRRAIRRVLADGPPPSPPQVTRLAGLSPLAALRDLLRVLDGAKVPFFFAAGTALGLVRAGRPLGADGDIDVGIFEEDFDRERLIEIFTADPMFDLDLHPQSRKVGLRHRGGAPVDIFPFYREGDRVWHDGVFVRWHNSPFEVTRQRVGDLEVPLPADVDRYLTENYGDWRTPWPGFDAFTDDAPNLEVTWPEHQRVHLIRRAFQFLVAGDRQAAAGELVKAQEEALAAEVTGGPTD